MEENCGERETKDGFCHLDGGCHCCGKQSRMEETNQWPYSPRGELGTNNNNNNSFALKHVCIIFFRLQLQKIDDAHKFEHWTAPRSECIQRIPNRKDCTLKAGYATFINKLLNVFAM